MELVSLFVERTSTGRIYLQNVDHCNTHSPFNPEVAPVRQLTVSRDSSARKPLEHVMEKCENQIMYLSAFNLGAIKSLDELEELAELRYALDSLLDYRYPVPAINATKGVVP